MKTLIKIFIFMLILPIFIFCSPGDKEKDSNSNAYAEIYFDIDSTKIGNTIVDTTYKIQFNPPIKWDKTSPEIFHKLSESLAATMSSEDIEITPIYIFINQNNGSLLSVSLIDSLKGEPSRKEEQYIRIIEQTFNSGEVIKQLKFSKDKIRFTQFLIKKDNNIAYKLLFSTHKYILIQFDYILPKGAYFDEIKSIEASIGSIKSINN